MAAYIQNDLNIGKICKQKKKRNETTNNANNISKAKKNCHYIPLSFWLVSCQNDKEGKSKSDMAIRSRTNLKERFFLGGG